MPAPLFIVVNGSGHIGHLNYVTERAKASGASIFVITANGNQQDNFAVSNYADNYLVIPGFAYHTGVNPNADILPMGTLFEETSMIVYDAIVAQLAKRLNLTEKQMSQTHRNVE